ncbi:uncharacterized protein LOC143822590 [Paroedura picta]|uniref:uncharacterized protein LOC143822590 n=1 Tax=Paroedura picta TaxID=143630 RepID=UPI004056B5EA
MSRTLTTPSPLGRAAFVRRGSFRLPLHTEQGEDDPATSAGFLQAGHQGERKRESPETKAKNNFKQMPSSVRDRAIPVCASPPSYRGRIMQDSFAVHCLKVLKELLSFVLFSYTVLFGALLLAGWTTYFLVLK